VAGEDEVDEGSPRGSGQVVMVVDDEPALVAMTEETLAGLGYEPAGFRDASLALDVFRKSPARFDALLTDQVMSGMSGVDLARAVHAVRPDMPIVMATGFGGAQLEGLLREAGVCALLQKPVHRSELSRQMHRVFAQRWPLAVDLPSDR
jgi:DNA-binding NtrC family response regulator